MAMDTLNRLGPQPDLSGARPAVGKSSPASSVSTSGGVSQSNADDASASLPPVSGPHAAPGQNEVKGAVKHLNEAVQSIRRELEFSIDDESGRTIVKVMDSETGDVIRQMPADEVLEIARHLKEFVESRNATVDSAGQSEKALGIIMKVQA